MSQAPSPVEEVEQDRTPAENDQQPDAGQNDDEMGSRDVDYDFEVKEQDRWLPIANGESPFLCSPTLPRVAPRWLRPR